MLEKNNITISNDFCQCIQKAEELLISSTGQPFNAEEKSLAQVWCKSFILPELIAEYLRGGNQYFPVAAARSILDRELNESEVDLVITQYHDGVPIEYIVDEIQKQAVENTDRPTC